MIEVMEQFPQVLHPARMIRRHHFQSHPPSFNLPEIILGGQDGLINVLGVILGVATATTSLEIVIVVGLAAALAESIAMAAVSYNAKMAESDYYQAILERERKEIEHMPERQRSEVRSLYQSYGFTGQILGEIVEQITSNKKIWLKVMMDEELEIEPVSRKQALPKALLVGVSAVIGSLIPLLPFLLVNIQTAILTSIIISALVLFAMGYYKAQKTGGRKVMRQGVKMMMIGMVAAFAGYVIGRILPV